MGSFRINPTLCCGIKELADISGLPTSEEVIKQTALVMAQHSDRYEHPPAFLFFDGVVGDRKRVYHSNYHADRSDNYGQDLADYIKANDLGVVTETPLAQNYNGNMLRMWVWAPKWEALKAVWEATREPSLTVAPTPTQYIMPTNGDITNTPF